MPDGSAGVLARHLVVHAARLQTLNRHHPEVIEVAA